MGSDEGSATTVPSAASSEGRAAHEPVTTGRYAEGDAAPVGRGGLGTVVATRDPLLRRRVAVKRMRGGTEPDFIREAQIAAQLDHPAIVPLFDLVRDATGALCSVMRLIDGESMAAHLAKATGLEQRLRLMPSFLQVSQALAYAHRRDVVHLDLKPHNVVLGHEGQTCVVDWGLARKVVGEGGEDARATSAPADAVDVSLARSVASGGSPAYMSPEQARGERTDKRTDVWGLGAILYELLTGRPPWLSPSVVESIHRARTGEPARVSSLAPRAPLPLAAICEKALRTRPEDRYPSAVEFAADVEAWLEGRAISALRRTPWEALRATVARNPWPFGAAAFALAVVVVATGVTTARVRAERDEARLLSRTFSRVASRGIEPLPENEPLVRSFTEAMERYYARLGREVSGEDRVDLGLAWDRLSRIHQRLGKLADARRDGARAVELLRAEAVAHPRDHVAAEGLAGALMTLANVASLEGKAAEELALRQETLAVIDATPQKDSDEPAWLDLRALALVQWLYAVGETPQGARQVDAARLEEARSLSSRLQGAGRAQLRTALLLDTWLAEERWRRGQSDAAAEHAARVESTVGRLLEQSPTLEARGLAAYGVLVAGTIAAWRGEGELARRRWAAIDRVVAGVDLSQPAAAPLAGERARTWLLEGRWTEAHAELTRLAAAGMPLGPLARFAALAADAKPPDSAEPEDAVDALALALFALRGGQPAQAAALLTRARTDGVSRQLLTAPGLMRRVARGQAQAEAFAVAWEEASARGDVAALDRALEDFARRVAGGG